MTSLKVVAAQPTMIESARPTQVMRSMMIPASASPQHTDRSEIIKAVREADNPGPKAYNIGPESAIHCKQMFSQSYAPVKFERDADVALIPEGQMVSLPAGTTGYLTQSLGGSFTVYVDGRLFRLAGDDADAIGRAAAQAGGARKCHRPGHRGHRAKAAQDLLRPGNPDQHRRS